MRGTSSCMLASKNSMFHHHYCKVLLFFLSASILPISDCLSAEITVVDGRQWTAESNGKPVKWGDADKICAALELGGYNDWVVPSLTQLASLHDPLQASGTIEKIQISSCCVWSSTTLLERQADDSDGLQLQYYRWGFMFDGGLEYYAVHIFDDGEVLCTRNR